jgi:hypothetical protein
LRFAGFFAAAPFIASRPETRMIPSSPTAQKPSPSPQTALRSRSTPEGSRVHERPSSAERATKPSWPTSAHGRPGSPVKPVMNTSVSSTG